MPIQAGTYKGSWGEIHPLLLSCLLSFLFTDQSNFIFSLSSVFHPISLKFSTSSVFHPILFRKLYPSSVVPIAREGPVLVKVTHFPHLSFLTLFPLFLQLAMHTSSAFYVSFSPSYPCINYLSSSPSSAILFISSPSFLSTMVMESTILYSSLLHFIFRITL